MAIKVPVDSRWCCTTQGLPGVLIAQCVKVTNVTKTEVTFHTSDYEDRALTPEEFTSMFRLTDCYGCSSLP